MNDEVAPKTTTRRIIYAVIVLLVVLVLNGVWLGPVTGPHGGGFVLAIRTASMLASRDIGNALIQYSKDHNGNFPEGKSSTEVFQQLVDQRYIADPDIFYFHYLNLPGKVQPDGKELRPENVCFDVSVPVDSSSSDKLPLVFLTGYKITYEAGAEAVPLVPVKISPRTWTEWWNGVPAFAKRPFIAVCYKDNSAQVIKADPDGSIPNFIPADFDPKGKAYRQLTP